MTNAPRLPEGLLISSEHERALITTHNLPPCRRVYARLVARGHRVADRCPVSYFSCLCLHHVKSLGKASSGSHAVSKRDVRISPEKVKPVSLRTIWHDLACGVIIIIVIIIIRGACSFPLSFWQLPMAAPLATKKYVSLLHFTIGHLYN